MEERIKLLEQQIQALKDLVSIQQQSIQALSARPYYPYQQQQQMSQWPYLQQHYPYSTCQTQQSAMGQGSNQQAGLSAMQGQIK